MKSTTAPRLALCRTELVGQLYTEHGFGSGFVDYFVLVIVMMAYFNLVYMNALCL